MGGSGGGLEVRSSRCERRTKKCFFVRNSHLEPRTSGRIMSTAPIEGDIRVDVTAIEKSLSELWRGEKKEGDHAVTRAALWNVVAHTSSSEHHATASETLCVASAAVPQRTIVVRANPNADADLASWISANCHRIGGGQQVCS